MLQRFLRIASLVSLLIPVVHASPVAAVSVAVPYIAVVQPAMSVTPHDEYVEFVNGGASELSVVGWKLQYVTSSGNTTSDVISFDGTVRAGGHVLLVNSTYASPTLPLNSNDLDFTDTNPSSGAFAASGGFVQLVDVNQVVVDCVGWGSAVARTGCDRVSTTLKSGFSYQRQFTAGVSSLKLLAEVQPGYGGYTKTPVQIVDLCGNLDGVQQELPVGYGYDEAGNCALYSSDLCSNIELIQETIPNGLVRNDDGTCTEPPVDVCLNIEGLQVSVPAGYVLVNGSCIKLEDRTLAITELLANASGTDTGQEFIEIYNPNDEPITLSGYTFQIGKSFEKSYLLQAGIGDLFIAPHTYVVFDDTDLGFTLLNTNSGVRLVAPAGNMVSQVTYENPADDMAWALIDDSWQYTNRPTPGGTNLPSLTEEDLVASPSSLTPCGVGKYRNPLTNRCRNIEEDATVLADCQDGYYRNPDTNRCRKITAILTSLTACRDGYERNPDTNRCNKIDDGSDTLTPCQTGYERNPDTNRCRKVVAPVSNLASSVASTTNATGQLAKNALFIVAGVGVLGYGIFEWRNEIMIGVRKLAGVVGKK